MFGPVQYLFYCKHYFYVGNTCSRECLLELGALYTPVPDIIDRGKGKRALLLSRTLESNSLLST